MLCGLLICYLAHLQGSSADGYTNLEASMQVCGLAAWIPLQIRPRWQARIPTMHTVPVLIIWYILNTVLVAILLIQAHTLLCLKSPIFKCCLMGVAERGSSMHTHSKFNPPPNFQAIRYCEWFPGSLSAIAISFIDRGLVKKQRRPW